MAKINNQHIRIIGGTHRGRKLSFGTGDRLRPTSNRVRETLFNWLMHDLPDSRCLDAFAGSGALGIEALSRGAQFVQFYEYEGKVARQIDQSLEEFDLLGSGKVTASNSLKSLDRAADQQFDIAFVDPPFGRGLALKMLNLLLDHQWLHADSLIYLEVERELDLAKQLEGRFEILKMKQTDQVSYGLLRVA